MSFRENLRKNLRTLAQEVLDNNLTEYLFRKKYNIPPNDPRLMELEHWEMALDLEMDSAFEKKIKALRKTCPKCKTIHYDNKCPTCGEKTTSGSHEYYEDPDFENYFKIVEEENRKPIKWEDVPDDIEDIIEDAESCRKQTYI
jgi:DNA repair exonuclease SbcCD ATPase subunit